MSADPAGFGLVNPMDGVGYSAVEALNWYSYVSNNPVKFIDPTGEQTATLTVSLPEITMVTQLSAFIQANPWLLVLLFPFLITGDSGPSNTMMVESDGEGGAEDTPSPVIDTPGGVEAGGTSASGSDQEPDDEGITLEEWLEEIEAKKRPIKKSWTRPFLKQKI